MYSIGPHAHPVDQKLVMWSYLVGCRKGWEYRLGVGVVPSSEGVAKLIEQENRFGVIRGLDLVASRCPFSYFIAHSARASQRGQTRVHPMTAPS